MGSCSIQAFSCNLSPLYSTPPIPTILHLLPLLTYPLSHPTPLSTHSWETAKMPESQGNSQPRTKTCGASSTKTPTTTLPNLEELVALSSGSGPIRNAEEAMAFLVQKTLITSNYDITPAKLATILFTVAFESKITETIASTIKSVGFLITHKLMGNISTEIATAISVKLTALRANTSSSCERE